MPETRSRPNILFVITDQQRHDTIGAAGFPYMHTPVLDRLAREGACFSHMFCTSPSCAPSRASLFTGLYPHTTGVYRNDEPWTHSWVQQLSEAGYRCVNVGKMHTSPFEDAFGFHERHVVENKDRATERLPFYLDQWDKAFFARGLEKPSRVTYRRRADYRESLGAFVWEGPPDLHSDVFVPAMAEMWLERYGGEEPFFLQVGIPGPHPPYDPTPEHLALYRDRNLPLPAIDPDEIAAQPEALRRLREQHMSVDHDAVVHLPHPTPEQLRRQREHYFANVSMIDEQIDRLLAALERRGVLENTVVVFTSDHGDCLNDHGHSQKWTMYEESVRVPCILWGPGRVKPVGVTDDLVSLFDLGPTVLELAGLAVPHWMEARSLLPLVGEEAGGAPQGRDHVFSEHAGDRILSGTAFMTMIRDRRWKLVHFVDSEEGQLFDIEADPAEMRNLWSDSAHTERKRALLDAIMRWRIRSDLVTQGWREGIALGSGPSRTPPNKGRQRGA